MSDATHRPAGDADLEVMARIYAHYVHDTVATFDLEAPTVDTWRERWEAARETGHPWLVCEQEGDVRGYATTSPHRPKRAYDLTVESTIYLEPGAAGQGLGRPLYGALLQAAAERFHLAVAGITLPNPSSVRLHESLGFTPVGRFSEIGFKFGEWRDVGWWQLRL